MDIRDLMEDRVCCDHPGIWHYRDGGAPGLDAKGRELPTPEEYAIGESGSAPILQPENAPAVDEKRYGGTPTLWRLWFGAYGDTSVYVWTEREDLDEALEVAAEWLAKYAPGLLTEPDYADAAKELDREHETTRYTEAWANAIGADATVNWDDEAMREISEHAETDLTYTESGWIASWEWGADEVNGTEYEHVAAISRVINARTWPDDRRWFPVPEVKDGDRVLYDVCVEGPRLADPRDDYGTVYTDVEGKLRIRWDAEVRSAPGEVHYNPGVRCDGEFTTIGGHNYDDRVMRLDPNDCNGWEV